MVKGVNRQVLEIHETGCEYFEKALFLGVIVLSASLCEFAKKLLLLFVKSLGNLNVDLNEEVASDVHYRVLRYRKHQLF